LEYILRSVIAGWFNVYILRNAMFLMFKKKFIFLLCSGINFVFSKYWIFSSSILLCTASSINHQLMSFIHLLIAFFLNEFLKVWMRPKVDISVFGLLEEHKYALPPWPVRHFFEFKFSERKVMKATSWWPQLSERTPSN
jgi:hypothetical protein